MNYLLWLAILNCTVDLCNGEGQTLNCLFMKGGNRKCYQGIVNHCYQKSLKGELLFYTISDYLVSFTIICTTARQYPGIRLLKLCLMPDHLHLAVLSDRRRDLSAFVRDYTSRIIRALDIITHGHSARFHSPFGSVPKVGDKKARTNFIYIDNNPVERKSVEKAEQYRWNFLAYASSTHPFSEKIVLSQSSSPLRKAIKTIKERVAKNLPMNHPLMQSLTQALTPSEKEQFIDYTISSYSVLDYQYVLRFFDGDYKKMLLATHSNTGSEYDINEWFNGKSDAVYNEMTRLLMKEYAIEDIHEILAYSIDKKYELFTYLIPRVPKALPKQIAAYLHMPLQENGSYRI